MLPALGVGQQSLTWYYFGQGTYQEPQPVPDGLWLPRHRERNRRSG